MSVWNHGESALHTADLHRKQIITCQCETTEKWSAPHAADLHRKPIVTYHCETMAENRLLRVTVRPWQKRDCYMSLWDHAADLHTSKSEKKTDRYMSLSDHAAVLQGRSRNEKKTDRYHYVSVRLRRTDMHCMQLICIESRGARRKQIVTCHCETMQLICIRLKVRRKQTVTCYCETISENGSLHVTVRHAADVRTSRSEKKTDCYMSLWDHAADLHISRSEKKTDCYMSLWDHAADLHTSKNEKKTDRYMSLWDHGRKQIVTCHCETCSWSVYI